MTYIGDVIRNQMRRLGITRDMILKNTIMDREDLEMLINDKLPAEMILSHDMSSLCSYLKII